MQLFMCHVGKTKGFSGTENFSKSKPPFVFTTLTLDCVFWSCGMRGKSALVIKKKKKRVAVVPREAARNQVKLICKLEQINVIKKSDKTLILFAEMVLVGFGKLQVKVRYIFWVK